MELIVERSKQKTKLPKCFCFNTFFYPSMVKDYSRVRGWTKRRNVDIFAMDKVFVPVHKGNHWCMAVINFRDKKIEYYDSLAGGPGQALSVGTQKSIFTFHRNSKNM
jgi:sentrin-specific protease 1